MAIEGESAVPCGGACPRVVEEQQQGIEARLKEPVSSVDSADRPFFNGWRVTLLTFNREKTETSLCALFGFWNVLERIGVIRDS